MAITSITYTSFTVDFGIPEEAPKREDFNQTPNISGLLGSPSVPPYNSYNEPDCCKFCNNNPRINPNASGICHCALPSIGKFK